MHESDVKEALRQRAYDFEDCLVAVCAKAIGCETIVTRDKKGFLELGVTICTPEELLRKM